MASDLHQLAFESFGLVAEVASDDRELFEGLPEVLPPGWRPPSNGGPVRARFSIMRDGTITVDGKQVPAAVHNPNGPLAELASTVHHHLAQHAPEHMFIHAGVVGLDGAGIVMPGSSMSGKSRLIDALVKAGATYYSDEYAVVDRAGLVHPYPKPLSLRGTTPGTTKYGIPVAVPAALTGKRPIRARLIVLTRNRWRAEWDPRELTSGEGVLAVIEHIVAARARPVEALAAARALVRDARIIASERDEAEPAAKAILALAAACAI